MRNNRPRRNKYRYGDRNFRRNDSEEFRKQDSTSFKDQRKFFNSNNNNASKLLEKYNNLARDASLNGDRILSENYYQYADHFLRIIEKKNLAENNSKNNSNNADPSKNSDDQIISEKKSNTFSKNSSKSEKI